MIESLNLSEFDWLGGGSNPKLTNMFNYISNATLQEGKLEWNGNEDSKSF